MPPSARRATTRCRPPRRSSAGRAHAVRALRERRATAPASRAGGRRHRRDVRGRRSTHAHAARADQPRQRARRRATPCACSTSWSTWARSRVCRTRTMSSARRAARDLPAGACLDPAVRVAAAAGQCGPGDEVDRPRATGDIEAGRRLVAVTRRTPGARDSRRCIRDSRRTFQRAGRRHGAGGDSAMTTRGLSVADRVVAARRRRCRLRRRRRPQRPTPRTRRWPDTSRSARGRTRRLRRRQPVDARAGARSAGAQGQRPRHHPRRREPRRRRHRRLVGRTSPAAPAPAYRACSASRPSCRRSSTRATWRAARATPTSRAAARRRAPAC